MADHTLQGFADVDGNQRMYARNEPRRGVKRLFGAYLRMTLFLSPYILQVRKSLRNETLLDSS